jgi:hypothetical protein
MDTQLGHINLKWTCRLRSVFEGNGYLSVQSRLLPVMREAEFVCSDGGSFPSTFRWQEFKMCYNRGPRGRGYYCPLFVSSPMAIGKQRLPSINSCSPESQ